MSGQKLLDDPETCVDALLEGLQAAFPRLRLLRDARSLVCPTPAPAPTVGLVSGGGAGHEPFCAGYVGEGMLAGAVSGSVFASPPTPHILKAIQSVAQMHENGVLLIIANYTGDCLNFGLAAEKAKKSGIKVETVLVGEDCALLDAKKITSTGRRGMCGLVFLYKIVGHLAAAGASLKTVLETAKNVVASMATMGFATKSCTLPGSSNPLISLVPGNVEFGLGVHGEAGIRTAKMSSASDLIEQVLDPILRTLHLQSGHKVAVLINNLGALTQLEQWIIPGIVCRQLEAKGIIVVRIYAGLVMTSLETVGLQICILNLSSEQASYEEWIKCLDAPTSAPAWPGSLSSVPSKVYNAPLNVAPSDNISDTKVLGPKLDASWSKILESALSSISQAIISKTDKLNELDSGCGDGDCGATLARLAKGILSKLPVLHLQHPAQLLLELADLSSELMGGTSGAVYGLFFSGASAELCHAESSNILNSISKSWKEGLQTVMQYSTARRGDRTMLDALIPACKQFEIMLEESSDGIVALKAALAAAQCGCEETACMSARAGRASYVSDALLSGVDAGAYGVVVWLEALYSTLSKC